MTDVLSDRHEGVTAQPPDLNAPDTEGDSDSPGGWGAKFAASLDLSLGRLTDSQDATTAEIRKLRREARQLPALVPVVATLTYLSTGFVVGQSGGTGIGVLIGGPEIGQQWNVRQIVVGGTTLVATPNGVAWFLVAPQIPQDLSITAVSDFTHAALPQISFYSAREFYVPPNSAVWMIITGGTNGGQYVVSATVEASPFAPAGVTVDN